MNAELQFLTALQGLHTPALDAVMLFFTRLGNAGFVWIALAAILLLFRRTRRAGCILALALVCDLVLCNFILKPLVHRVRPCDLLPEAVLLIPHPSDYSFPSGHTAASFTAVAALWLPSGWPVPPLFWASSSPFPASTSASTSPPISSAACWWGSPAAGWENGCGNLSLKNKIR